MFSGSLQFTGNRIENRGFKLSNIINGTRRLKLWNDKSNYGNVFISLWFTMWDFFEDLWNQKSRIKYPSQHFHVISCIISHIMLHFPLYRNSHPITGKWVNNRTSHGNLMEIQRKRYFILNHIIFQSFLYENCYPIMKCVIYNFLKEDNKSALYCTRCNMDRILNCMKWLIFSIFFLLSPYASTLSAFDYFVLPSQFYGTSKQNNTAIIFRNYWGHKSGIVC